MLEVKFYDTVDDSLLKFAVIISQSNGKWVFCKHKERDTYEAPGGHREVGEDILETAKRELQEETGAIQFDIKPICVYSVTGKNSVNETGEETFGLLCFAEITEFSGKLESEIEKVELMDELPESWTYPMIQPTESKIYSIFDYLYKQYTEERRVYLQKHKKVSEYDSENLMYSLIEDIISANKYSSLDVVCHFPLNMLIKNPELLNEQECQYAMNPATHLDFLIYNRIGKKPVLAIEVDGYEYHKEDTVQASRDLLKNHIMELYEIPLLRFMTNGSGEKEKIIEMLDKLVG